MDESVQRESKRASENRRKDAERKIIQSVADVWRTPRLAGESNMSPQMEGSEQESQ